MPRTGPKAAAPGVDDQRPWPVWLIWSSPKSDPFILETRVRLQEARGYEVASEATQESAHEMLPAHIASPLLEIARAQ